MKRASELVEHLENQSAFRKRELQNVDLLLRQERKKTSTVASLCRSSICMSYAHFEGFVIDSAKSYIMHVKCQGYDFNNLSDHLKVNALHRHLRELEQCNRFERFRQVIEIAYGQSNCELSTSMIDSQGNLNSSTLRDILDCCGLQYAPFETRANFIDERLLATRNSIAHGSLAPVSYQDHKDASDFVMFSMGELTTQFQNAVVGKLFLREEVRSTIS